MLESYQVLLMSKYCGQCSVPYAMHGVLSDSIYTRRKNDQAHQHWQSATPKLLSRQNIGRADAPMDVLTIVVRFFADNFFFRRCSV